MKNPAFTNENGPIIKTNLNKSFVPPHPVWWKSLRLTTPAGTEIGIRHEEKSAFEMRLPQAPP